ncbi:MBL fold metallo-hydrolase [Desulfovibrio sp. Huiquan2017]|uniref:MBL fold metallo-hydrolase n=1 Tax=Desulfovibrio sp. Huiquan2017 TaxID=2816861 RepID=UPI001A938C61|nr:MBL fold metallo-hydrolase [Desulfovibrio sp. Huiquan2017]
MSKTKMRYLGWSNILIQGEGGDLVFDPFFRKMYGANWADLNDYDKVRVICISHGHHEHYLDSPIIAKKTGAKIVSSAEVCDHLRKHHGIPNEQLVPVLPFEEVELSGFRIVPFDWHHRPINYMNFFKGSVTAAFNFVSNNLLRSPWRARYYGFVVKTPQGESLLNLTEGMNPLFSDGEIDVLKQRFAPDVLIGGHQLVYEGDVARCVQKSGVGRCVLYHPHEKLFGQMKIPSTPVGKVEEVVRAAAPDVEIKFPAPMESFEI